MTDTISVQFSLSVDTLLNIIGGAMIVITVVVVSVMGSKIYLPVNIKEGLLPLFSFVCQALLFYEGQLFHDPKIRVTVNSTNE